MIKNRNTARFAIAVLVKTSALWLGCGGQDPPAENALTQRLSTGRESYEPTPYPPMPYEPTPVPRRVLQMQSYDSDFPPAFNESVEASMSGDQRWLAPDAAPTLGAGIFRAVSTVYTEHKGKAVASVEERTFFSDVVVRARLSSTSTGMLNFGSSRYLKGTGPRTFSVRTNAGERDTQRDGQDAILFLNRLTGQSADFEFLDSTAWHFWPDASRDSNLAVPEEYTGDLPDGYAVGSRNPVWLPVSGLGGTRSSSNSVITEYMAGSPVFVRASDIQNTIDWVVGAGSDVERDARRSAGTPPNEEYRRCVTSAISMLRVRRDFAAHGVPLTYHGTVEETAPSGAPEGANVTVYKRGASRDTHYDTFSIRGPDAALFGSRVVDDNENPSDGYVLTMVTLRPLPAGRYSIEQKTLLGAYVPCGFTAPISYRDFRIMVGAPQSVVHEAMFDPATTPAGVGYSATDAAPGVLRPAGFSMGGRAATITGLTWRDGEVVLSLSPFVPLGDHQLQFIVLDGSTSLALRVSDATADRVAGTLTWTAADRPWSAGDQLMLRIGP